MRRKNTECHETHIFRSLLLLSPSQSLCRFNPLDLLEGAITYSYSSMEQRYTTTTMVRRQQQQPRTARTCINTAASSSSSSSSSGTTTSSKQSKYSVHTTLCTAASSIQYPANYSSTIFSPCICMLVVLYCTSFCAPLSTYY